MSLSCREVRRRLEGGSEDSVRAHLAGCPACAELSDRWRAVRHRLGEEAVAPQPDAAFARRVTARIEHPPDALAWAALRVFPVAAALALVLTWWTWAGPETAVSYDPDALPSELARWIIDPGELEP